jgi:hypothetical protein
MRPRRSIGVQPTSWVMSSAMRSAEVAVEVVVMRLLVYLSCVAKGAQGTLAVEAAFVSLVESAV